MGLVGRSVRYSQSVPRKNEKRRERGRADRYLDPKLPRVLDMTSQILCLALSWQPSNNANKITTTSALTPATPVDRRYEPSDNTHPASAFNSHRISLSPSLTQPVGI